MSNQSEVKFMEQNMSNDNKKNIRLNSIRGTQRFTKPSQTNVDAKVQINIEIAIPKLEKIAQKYVGIINPQANAKQYIIHDANCEYNLSIVVRREMRRNTFKPHNDVRLDEYVYYGKKMAKVENPLTQIINSIIVFLKTGVYEDTTGVAFRNTSPNSEL